MKFIKTIRDLAIVVISLQWAYHLTVFGYAKWGFIGGALGFISSPALLPFSPFTAWMFFARVDLIWFYSLVGVIVVGIALEVIFKTRITSDYPYR